MLFFPAQYFNYKLRSTNTSSNGTETDSSDNTQLQTMYESYFSVAAQIPNVVVQILNTAFKHK